MKSLIELQNYYLDTFCGKDFVFDFEKREAITIQFHIEEFCHLLGIQHVYENDKHYIGRAGWDKIADERVTTEVLKNYNKGRYNQIKERILYFDKIESVLKN